MPRVCVVKHCKSLGTKDARARGITFHALPTNPQIRTKWLENIRKVNRDGTPWIPYTDAAVCSKHFKQSCFTGPAVGVPNKPIAAPEVYKDPANQRGQGKKCFFEEDPTGVDTEKSAVIQRRKKSKKNRSSAVNAAKETKKEEDGSAEAEEDGVADSDDDTERDVINSKYAKPNAHRRRLMYSAVPTVEMGIPSSKLAHQNPVDGPTTNNNKRKMTVSSSSPLSGQSPKSVKKEGEEAAATTTTTDREFRMLKSDAEVLDRLGISKEDWSRLSVNERRERRLYHQSLCLSLSDHSYSSPSLASMLLLGGNNAADKMAAEIKRLKILTETLSQKLSAEKHKTRRVQASLAKACSMLEHCAEYEFLDENGRKIARPKGSTPPATALLPASQKIAKDSKVGLSMTNEAAEEVSNGMEVEQAEAVIEEEEEDLEEVGNFAHIGHPAEPTPTMTTLDPAAAVVSYVTDEGAQIHQFPVTSHIIQQFPLTSEQLPVTSEQLSMTSEPLEVTSEQLPVTSEHLPVTSEQFSVTSEQLSVMSEQLPVTSEMVHSALEHTQPQSLQFQQQSLPTVVEEVPQFYELAAAAAAADAATDAPQAAPQPLLPMHHNEYFQPHPDSADVATAADGSSVIYHVLSENTVNAVNAINAVNVVNGVDTSSVVGAHHSFEQLGSGSNAAAVVSADDDTAAANAAAAAFLLESSAAVATAAVNPDGTEKVEFVNILT